MPLQAALARADADLAASRVPMARQRLRSLIADHPTDLTARHRPAAVYRLYGELAEAGRRNFLDESADPAETAAFEARHPDPPRRMIALCRRAPENHAPTGTARARLTALREPALREPALREPALRESAVGGDGGPVTWTDLYIALEDRGPGPEPHDLLLPTCLITAAALLSPAVIGTITTVLRFL
ncbi:DUF6584 family protein [Kitasatospora sp. NPDC004614]|uniref:DUF6584 family protein n=1 Tax=unclassified Kitasatospora TaxID=2633591 RepID=UPI0036C01312